VRFEVQDPPAIMADHEKAIVDAEGLRGDRKEILRRDGFSVIAMKSGPYGRDWDILVGNGLATDSSLRSWHSTS
jgi:hypothetical protein